MDIDSRLVGIVDQLSTDLGISRDVLLNTRLADLDIDSMDMVTLVFDIEEALEVEIDVNDLDTQQTVAQLMTADVAVSS